MLKILLFERQVYMISISIFRNIFFSEYKKWKTGECKDICEIHTTIPFINFFI